MVDTAARENSKAADQPIYRRVPAYLIRGLEVVSVTILAEALKGEDMPVPQWAVLTGIYFPPDIDQSKLSDIVSIDRTNTGRFVDQLEAKGLVERRASEADRGGRVVWCTGRGRKPRGG